METVHYAVKHVIYNVIEASVRRVLEHSRDRIVIAYSYTVLRGSDDCVIFAMLPTVELSLQKVAMLFVSKAYMIIFSDDLRQP